jgi:hypothetical protein
MRQGARRGEPTALLMASVASLVLGAAAVLADNGLYAEYFKDTPSQWGAFGSDYSSPQPFMRGTDPNIDFTFGNNTLQYFSARWRGYLRAGEPGRSHPLQDGHR